MRVSTHCCGRPTIDEHRAGHQAYMEFTRRVAKATEEGRDHEYKAIDEHYFDSLVEGLEKWDLAGMWDEQTMRAMSRVWRRLDPWPDTVEGITALNAAGYQTATLSNGSLDLLRDMADHAKLGWTHIFSAAMFKSYKPNPKVYLGVATKLNLRPQQWWVSTLVLLRAHVNAFLFETGVCI